MHFENLDDIDSVIPLCEPKISDELRARSKTSGYAESFRRATWFAVNRLSESAQEVLYIRGVQNKWPEEEDMRKEVAPFLQKIIDGLVKDIEVYFAAIRVHNYFYARNMVGPIYHCGSGTFIEPDPDLTAFNQCNWIF